MERSGDVNAPPSNSGSARPPGRPSGFRDLEADDAAPSPVPLAAPAGRTAVVFQTHHFDRAMQREFRRIRAGCRPGYEPILLLHDYGTLPEAQRLALAGVPHFAVTPAAIRDPRYPRKSGLGDRSWNIATGGHVDLIFLKFWEAHPGYDHYWLVEYDVRYTGDWGALFARFESSPSDLIATTMRSWGAHPHWPLWETLWIPGAAPPGADGRPPPAQTDWIGSLMSVFRVSSRAARAVHEAYLAGWGGHLETTWATIVAWNGMAVEDLGGEGEFVRPANRGRFYTNRLTSHTHAPGTLVFRPARVWPGLRRDMLWHPVKPLRAKLKSDLIELRDWASERRKRLRRLAATFAGHG